MQAMRVLPRCSLPLRRPLTASTTASIAVRGLATSILRLPIFPPHTVINMPALSPTMTQGNVGAWKKSIGDQIVPGDVLVEIETDKAQMEFECQDEGYLAKILVDSGAKDIPVGQPVAVMVEDASAVEKFKDYSASDAAAPAAPKSPEAVSQTSAAQDTSSAPAASQEASTSNSSSSTDAAGGRIFASPLAKSLASQNSVDLSSVQGSGPNSRIVKADVEAAMRAPKPAASSATAASAAPTADKKAAAPAAAGPAGNPYTDIPNSNMRKVIAQRLTDCKRDIPHYYLTVEVNMDRVFKLREVLNGKSDTKLSVNDFVVKASALALKEVPAVNSAWMGDFIRQYENADISVAVATPAGLITPIVARAETLGLSTISRTLKDLSARARSNKLKPQEYQGGTFTISNLGMYGITQFTAIINPPQSCILAVGGTEAKVIKEQGEFVEAKVMRVTLSCDHRVVDGAVGSQWINAFKKYLEEPLTMML
ncbi:pyruvate dehydrogenase complex dihydrolipoamide acetyltransferase component (E2) [Sorochytrium milnesiophthora]